MGEKMNELTDNLAKLVKEQGLSPAQAVLKAGISLDNKSKLLELAQEVGIVDQPQSDSTSLQQMAQQLVAGLDPNTKQSLASFLSEVIAESNVGAPPTEVQQFLANLVPNQESDS
ncbi:MAG: hypothetical protein WAO22_02525 [bacterium]|jgi:hypothetical protein|nr:hypothetical protein [Bacillota bacterium]